MNQRSPYVCFVPKTPRTRKFVLIITLPIMMVIATVHIVCAMITEGIDLIERYSREFKWALTDDRTFS